MSEFKIDIEKIMGKPTIDSIEKTNMLINANKELLDALHIMISAIEFPSLPKINEKRMREFILKYCK